MSEIDSKTCIGCGVDCSDRPRVKDRYGRYLCRACYDDRKAERARESNIPTTADHPIDPDAPTSAHPPAGMSAAKTPSSAPAPRANPAAPAAPSSAPTTAAASAGAYALADSTKGTANPPPTEPSDDDVMRALLDEPAGPGLAPADTQPCPQCRSRIAANAVICANCGLNLQTGKTLQTRILKPLEDKAPKASGRAVEIPWWAPVLLVGGGYATWGYYSTLNEAAWLAWLLTCLVFFFVTYIWSVVVTFQEGESLWGWIGVAGIFCSAPVQIAFIVWSLFQTHRPVLVSLMIINLAGYIGGIVIGFNYHDLGSSMGP